MKSKCYLYSFITVVRGDNPVLGEYQVDGVARLPPIKMKGQGGVGLCVPLGHLLEPIQNIA